MLIVQGNFRSGTSALFRALCNDPGQTCYYEPLHPNLLEHVSEARAARPSHDKSSLYTQYTSLLPRLRRIYRPSFWKEYATVDEDEDASLLQTYLQFLSDSSDRVVLQTNRTFWMAPWLHRTFPDARFVHLVRDPRSVVWSQLTTGSGERVRMNWPVLGRLFSFSSGDLSNVFSSYAYHGAYRVQDYFHLALDQFSDETRDARSWAHSCLRSVRECRPYVQALAVWGAQAHVCHQEAQSAFGDRYLCLRYQDLCASPHDELHRIYALNDGVPPSSALQYAKSHLHSNRVASWQQDEDSRTYFRKGIQQAGLTPVLEEFGYNIRLN
ncbi:sulfotransferase [Salinibacter ruber]|jgi:hypothetical protein|uniref:sulfotransferase n=1 Tax=Salinibacter ruber TaxID=146919 RepID=UPI00244FB640|nr:hypothetical protein [Salinibacter ruber]